MHSSFGVVTYKNKLLLLLRDNNPHIFSPNTWSLLGGGAENDETPEQTLIRELKEEANIDVKSFMFLLEIPDLNRFVYHIPLLDDDVKNIKLGDEGQELKFFALKELGTINLSRSLKKYFEKYQLLLKKILSTSP